MANAETTKQQFIYSYFNLVRTVSRSRRPSVAEICKRAGSTATTFYRYFDSVEDLVSFIRNDSAQLMFSDLVTQHLEKVSDFFEFVAYKALPAIYLHRTRFRILNDSDIDFGWWTFLENNCYQWLMPYCIGLGKKHNLHDAFIAHFISNTVVIVISIWMTEEFPENPDTFSDKFLELMKIPLANFLQP